MICDFYWNIQQNSVKSVKQFLPYQYVTWSGTPRIHHYFLFTQQSVALIKLSTGHIMDWTFSVIKSYIQADNFVVLNRTMGTRQERMGTMLVYYDFTVLIWWRLIFVVDWSRHLGEPCYSPFPERKILSRFPRRLWILFCFCSILLIVKFEFHGSDQEK
mgnify:CR=1 FL=1